MQALSSPIFEQIRLLVEQSRLNALRRANYALLELYWQIGRLIVEDEQGGAARAEYGKGLITNLPKRLTMRIMKNRW